MIFIALWLIVVPDGRLLSVGIPRVLAVLQKSVEHRFVLPLIIGATEHEAVLYPDTHTGEVEACVNECLPKGEPFGIRMEAVGHSTFFEVVSHVLECRQKELVKFFTL